MSQPPEHDRAGLAWQRGIWDRYPELYRQEVDRRFAPVVEHVITRAALQPGQHVLDLGTGTGAVALQAAALIGPGGELQFVVKLGRDADNFYLYRTPVHAGPGRAAWEPEVRVDLRRDAFLGRVVRCGYHV